MSQNPPSASTPGAALRLYVAGNTPGALRALESRIRILDQLGHRIEIEIVDILEHPEEAEKAGILATPTLSDESVQPPRRLVGDISHIDQVLDYFGYRKKDDLDDRGGGASDRSGA